jgi:hypothetical protein
MSAIKITPQTLLQMTEVLGGAGSYVDPTNPIFGKYLLIIDHNSFTIVPGNEFFASFEIVEGDINHYFVPVRWKHSNSQNGR